MRWAPGSSRLPEPPALSAELAALLRRMRLPYLRAAAPRGVRDGAVPVLGLAEVLRVVIAEEVVWVCPGAAHRYAAGLPKGQTFDSWREVGTS